ncbi:MAG: hypothetical protein ACKKL6_00045 [Candidatus Komeilibacteria bacterium]
MSEIPTMGWENLNAPERLTDKEVKEIVERIDDERLHADEDIEHFTIHLENRVVNIPKRNKMHIKDDSGRISNIKIEDYIRQVIEEYEG